jgi:Uma2 family endonuclease
MKAGVIMPQPQEDEHYTYEDYYTWDDEKRWELIRGIPYAMEQSYSMVHQTILVELVCQLSNFLKGKPCEAYMCPLDVRLNPDDGDDIVVEPDILVICDKSKLRDERCITGAPDFIIEILAPYTVRHDRLNKFNLYKNAGVREYWIVDPETKTVSANILRDGAYVSYAYGDEDEISVAVLPGCTINMNGVFTSEED